jgi:hypothetical protein
MTPHRWSPLLLAGWILFALLLALSLGGSAAAQTSPVPGLTVTLSLNDVSLKSGETITFTSTITNSRSQPTPRLIATLNLVSVGLDAYVDPEDWSPNRFQSVDPVPAGGSATQSWDVHAIQGGDYSIFIVVLPDAASATEVSVVGGPPVHLHVDLKRNLNPGGTLPVALAVPALIAVAFFGAKFGAARSRKAKR